MRNNIINRYKLNHLVNEAVQRFMLNEDQEGDSQSAARKLYMQHFYSGQIFPVGSEEYEASKEFVNDIRTEVPNLKIKTPKKLGKFTYAVARMYLNGELTDVNTLNQVNAVIPYLAAHYDEYNMNLQRTKDGPALSAQELINLFKPQFDADLKAEKEEIEKMALTRNEEYDIVPINSFEEAQEYYEYTNPDSRWCLTHMENMYDTYTCDGLNQIYFCLKKGFEDMTPQKGEGCPLDEYGLSMLCIIVDSNGDLRNSTCRWNHANGGNDSVMRTPEISRLLGVRFNEVFKPNNKFNNAVEDALNKLRNGEHPEWIFDEVDNDELGNMWRVKLLDKYNILKPDNTFLFNRWLNYIGYFENGVSRVQFTKGQWNLIDTKCNLLCDRNYEFIESFRDVIDVDVVRVRIAKERFNIMDSRGKLLCDRDYKNIQKFEHNLSVVKIEENQYNIINTNGDLLCNRNFIDIDIITEFLIKVKVNDNQWNIANTNGDLLCDKNFTWMGAPADGVIPIGLGPHQFNLINTNGKILCDRNFFSIDNYDNCGFPVQIDEGKWNIINTEGKLLCKRNYYIIDDFHYNVAKVKKVKWGVGWNIIDQNGNELCDKDYLIILDFNWGLAKVENDKYKWNIINVKGEELLDKYYDEILSIRRDKVCVMDNGKPSEININIIQETIKLNIDDINNMVMETLNLIGYKK